MVDGGGLDGGEEGDVSDVDGAAGLAEHAGRGVGE